MYLFMILPSCVGKCNRGLMVVASLRHICDRELTDDEEKKAIILGWCVEWVSMYMYIIEYSV